VSEEELLIDAARLSYPEAAGRTPGRGVGGVYEYAADGFDKVPGSFLFWGPYLDLDAGVYALYFLGQVEGELSVEFIHDMGKMRVKRISLSDLDAPACVVLVQAVKKFEIRGLKTRALHRLRLEGIRLHCVHRVAGSR
jgi:hypothetical protein